MVAVFFLVMSALPINMPVKADAGYDITELKVIPATTQEQCFNITISVKVKNIGDAMGKSITLKFLVGSIDIGSKVMTNLSAGGISSTNLTWTIPRTFTPGKVNISVSIDGYAVRKDISYSIVESWPSLTVNFEGSGHGYPHDYSTTAQSGRTVTLKIRTILYNSCCFDITNVTVVIFRASDHKELGRETGIFVRTHETVNQTVDIKLKSPTSVKLTAEATYGDGFTATSPANNSPSARVSSHTSECYISPIITLAVFFPMVVIYRRKK